VIVTPAEVMERAPTAASTVDSAAEVEDLLRTFQSPQEALKRHVAPVRTKHQRARHERVRPKSRGRGIIIFLGVLSLLVGLAAVGLCFVPTFARYAVPAGAAGVVLALIGVVIAMGKRVGGIGLPIGGAGISAAGIAVALLSAYGLIPLGPHGPQVEAGSTPVVNISTNHSNSGQPPTPMPAALVPPDGYVLATSPIVVGDVEIRIDSVLLLQPAVYTGNYSSLQTLSDRKLQITFGMRATGAKRVTYQPWRRTDVEGADAKLTQSDGTLLMLDSLPSKPGVPATLPVGAATGPITFGPRDKPASDVLLFEPPLHVDQDLKLDLPGENIGAAGTTLHWRIPAAKIKSS
jgi:hypothetical protein